MSRRGLRWGGTEGRQAGSLEARLCGRRPERVPHSQSGVTFVMRHQTVFQPDPMAFQDTTASSET